MPSATLTDRANDIGLHQMRSTKMLLQKLTLCFLRPDSLLEADVGVSKLRMK